MHYHIITIFPEIFTSFLGTSLIAKAQEKSLIQIDIINPRDFCTDKHKQIDDMPYGGGAGMLLKAQPVIDAIKQVGENIGTAGLATTKVVIVAPAKQLFTQEIAHARIDGYEHLIIVCGRYEGIDHRVELWAKKTFGDDFSKISLGHFVTLGGEVPAMMLIEATARLVPAVIKEEESWQEESYRPEQGGKNIEHPQYTRPEEVEGLAVPEMLFSGHHANIAKWRKEQTR